MLIVAAVVLITAMAIQRDIFLGMAARGYEQTTLPGHEGTAWMKVKP